jgi:hypothetical protein
MKESPRQVLWAFGFAGLGVSGTAVRMLGEARSSGPTVGEPGGRAFCYLSKAKQRP